MPGANMTSQASSILFMDDPVLNRLVDTIILGLPEDQQKGFRDEAMDCAAYAKAQKLVSLLVSKSHIIMAQTSEKDIEGCYQVLMWCLDKLKGNELSASVAEITANLKAQPEDKPVLRLKMMCNLYNRLNSGSEERFSVLVAIIEFARDTKQLEVLSDFFEDLDSWKKNWKGLTAENERKLYLLVSETLQASGKASEAQRLLVKYLATFGDDAKAEDLAEIHPYAVKGVIGAIKEPIAALTSVSNLLSLKPIKLLEGHPKFQKVFELLQIFSYGKLSDFLGYCEKNPDVVKEYGINKDKAIGDMRILSLSLLASEYEEIPYDVVASTLNIPKSEVEDWVVNAITTKLIEARMDQQQEMVMITRSTHRHFTKEEWIKLQDKLTGWRKNVHRLLQTIKDARSPA